MEKKRKNHGISKRMMKQFNDALWVLNKLDYILNDDDHYISGLESLTCPGLSRAEISVLMDLEEIISNLKEEHCRIVTLRELLAEQRREEMKIKRVKD